MEDPAQNMLFLDLAFFCKPDNLAVTNVGKGRKKLRYIIWLDALVLEPKGGGTKHDEEHRSEPWKARQRIFRTRISGVEAEERLLWSLSNIRSTGDRALANHKLNLKFFRY